MEAGAHLSNDKHNIYESKDTTSFAYISTNQQ